MFEELPPEVLEISIAIVEYARSKIQKSMDPNLVITLADHIAFALKRQEENLQLKLSLAYDIPYLYETEMEIGQKSLRLIKHKLGVALPEVEAAYIALHIINSEAMVKNQSDEMDDEAIIEAISDIIETHFQIEIDRKSFNYSRFATHMHYMIKRGRRHELISSTNNQKLYETLRDESPQTFACLGKIAEYLAGTLDWSLSTDECVYLMIHINRFTFREDCNQ
jgi:beta-glucoside operon transcriptional antiterminator